MVALLDALAVRARIRKLPAVDGGTTDLVGPTANSFLSCSNMRAERAGF